MRHLLAAAAALALAGPAAAAPKHLLPVAADALAAMSAKGVDRSAPILVRAFKRESTLEVWKRARTGRYELIKAFPICRWSGRLGPKRAKGDRQTPEGIYSVGPSQMNPSSQYHLAFDTGFPNAVDRAARATGSAIMVHGTCSSSGCYAMTDRGIEEIYALAREAFAGGQRAFQFQSYPFHMTAENLVKARLDPNVAFWVQLKNGSDRFEATGEEPEVEVVGGRYVFRPYADRATEVAALRRLNDEAVGIARLLSEGIGAVRWDYADGGQHPVFSAQAALVQPKGDVSRPEALALAGTETAIPGTAVRRPFLMPAQWPMPPEPVPAVAATTSAPAGLDLRAALALAGMPMPGPARADVAPGQSDPAPTPVADAMRWPVPLAGPRSDLDPVPVPVGTSAIERVVAGAASPLAPWRAAAVVPPPPRRF